MHKAWLTCQSWFIPNSSTGRIAFCDLQCRLTLYYLVGECLFACLLTRYFPYESKYCVHAFVCVCSELFDKDKWLYPYPIMLYTRCCPVCMGFSMWLRPWNCNKARASHGEDGWLCSAQKYEILPFVYVYVFVWERIILVELPRLK